MYVSTSERYTLINIEVLYTYIYLFNIVQPNNQRKTEYPLTAGLRAPGARGAAGGY